MIDLLSISICSSSVSYWNIDVVMRYFPFHNVWHVTQACLRICSSLPKALMQYHFLSGRVVFLGQGGDVDQDTQQNNLKAVGYY